MLICTDTNGAIPRGITPAGVHIPGGDYTRAVVGFDLFDRVLPATSVGFDNDEVINFCPAPQWELDNKCEDNDITAWSFNRAECP